MKHRNSRPRPLRAACVALGLVLGAHVGLREIVEGTRLRLLRWMSGPAAVLHSGGRPAAVRGATTSASESRRTERERLFAATSTAVLPLLDYRKKEGVLVVGAGAEAGVVFGAPLFAREGLIGHVERLEAHLSRVRVIAARGARTAVAAERVSAGLPGGIERLVGVVEGDGVFGFMAEGALLEALRIGDRLAAFGSGAYPVGVVISEGVRPRVRFFADAANIGAAAIAGLNERTPTPGVFEFEPLRVLAEPAVGGRGALLTGIAAYRLAPGAAVQSGGTYLGRIERTAGDVAAAERRDDPGHEVGARLVRDGAESGATLRAEGGGRFRIVGGELPLGGSDEVEAFTAGGEGLTPSDLYLGRFKIAGAVLESMQAGGRWPEEIAAAVFVFEAERLRLNRVGGK